MKVFGISAVRKNKFINDLDRTSALGNTDILPECLSVQDKLNLSNKIYSINELTYFRKYINLKLYTNLGLIASLNAANL